MDHHDFDALTRSVASRLGTRRQALRTLGGALLGGTFVGVATRLGLGDITAAKANKHQPKHEQRPQAERKAHQQLRDEGKGKHKDKGKGKQHHKPKDPKPSDPSCSLDTYRCPDGTCVPWDQCCTGQKRCSNGSGPRCLPATACCPEEKICDDGSCASQEVCCPGERLCDDGGCAKPNDCCAGEQRCLDGTCLPLDACCYDVPAPDCSICQRHVCLNGEEQCQPREPGASCTRPDGLAGTCCNGDCSRAAIICPRYPWREFNPDTCTCQCRDGGHDTDDLNHKYCCPADFPYATFGGMCYADPDGTHVCMMAHHPCPSPYPGVEEWCCPDGP